MAQHIEINPDPKSLPLSLADRAMAMARGMQTSNTGTIRVPTGNGNDFIAGKGAQDGANWIDSEGVQHPIVDTSSIDKAAQDAQKAADAAAAKADEAIKQGEQVRKDAQAGIDDVRKQAQDAAAKADGVRSDLQAEMDEAKADAAASSAKADKASEKAEQVRKDTETMVRAVRDSVDAAESKAQNASEKADKLAGSITDVTATVNGHSSQLKELSTKVEGAVSANGETVKSVTELKQTVTGLSATVAQNSKTATDALSKATSVEQTANGLKTQVTQNSKTASDALSKATSVEQTANGIAATLSKDYQTAKAADAKYSAKTELTATSQSLAAKITEAAKKGDQALSKASSVEATASGLTATIGEQAKRLDSTVSTLNTVKATADSNSATIRQTSGSFLMDPCFATGADKVYNISVNADDPLGVDLPGTATSYGKSVGGYDDKASNVTVTTIPGHTYRMEFDWKPASDMPADVDENIGAFVWKPNGSGYSDFNIAGVGSNRDVRWHHVVKDWTAPSDESWPKVIPAIRTPPRARYLLTNWRFYDYTASREILSKATSVEQDLNGFKASVSQTYETKSDSDAKKTTLEQNLNGFETTVSNTYLSKSDAGKTYATQSSLSQTSSGLTSKITEAAKKGDAAMSKVTTLEQTANGLSAKVGETARTLDATVQTVNQVKSTADSNKATISQVSTTANDALSRTSSLEQNLSGFKSEVGQTYATKSDMGKQSSGSNLWCNQLFDPDKPQITRLVDNVTAPNGSRVNLLAARDNFNAGTSFPVVPGHTYAVTAYCKQIKGSLSLRAGIWYTQRTSGHAFETYVDAESTTPLDDGWMAATWRVTCPGGKSRGCVYFQIDNWPPDSGSTQWLVANVTCSDVTGLQPAGDYATNSSLTQTADSIKASVAENARKADAAMSKASSVEQTASGLSTRISEVAKKGDQTVQSLNTLSADVTGFKQTVQQTYATGARVSQLESSLDGFRSTVSQTYSPKSEVTNLAASTVRRYGLNMCDKAAWHKIGYWQPLGQGSVAAIHVYTGRGTNGGEDQNSEFTIMLKKGWTGSSNNHRSDYGVNLIRQRNAANVQVKAFAYHPGEQYTETTPVDIWIYQPWGYGGGHYDVSYDGSWSHQTTVQTDAPVEDSTHTLQSSVGYETLSNTSYVDQTSRSVSLGVVEEYKNGQHGSALATQSDITAAKDSITSTVSSTYATKTGVTQEISSKITQNNNSLDVRFSTKTETRTAQDTANTANSHASDAQSRVGSLESCIRMTSAGVRVGHIVNGEFQGCSALLNSAGSFDVLDSNSSLLARFDAKGLTMAGGRLWLNDVPQHRNPDLDWEGRGNGGFSIKLTHFGGRMFLVRASTTVRAAHVGAADYKITNALPYSFIYTRIAGYLHVNGLPVGSAFGLVDGKTLYISTEDYGNEVSQEISGVAIVSGF
jgi:hypothetical protein|nr:MAG TPA: chromosome segregation protein [Caudoviricetes sp.]